RKQLVRGLALVKRGNERLDDTYGPVEGPDIAPRLEIMCLGDVPMTEFSGLVFVRPEMDSQANLEKPLSELHVRRGSENRVATQDHQHIDLVGFNIGNQLAQGLELIDRV